MSLGPQSETPSVSFSWVVSCVDNPFTSLRFGHLVTRILRLVVPTSLNKSLKVLCSLHLRMCPVLTHKCTQFKRLPSSFIRTRHVADQTIARQGERTGLDFDVFEIGKQSIRSRALSMEHLCSISGDKDCVRCALMGKFPDFMAIPNRMPQINCNLKRSEAGIWLARPKTSSCTWQWRWPSDDCQPR